MDMGNKELKKEAAKLAGARIADPGKYLEVLEIFARKYEFTNYSVEEVTEETYPLIHAVGKGSKSRSYVVKLNFGNKKAKAVVVGKGVCYDSGGYYMKPSSMENMFLDKTGAALAFMYGVLTGTPAIIFLTNNLVSDSSYLNGEVYAAKNGKRVMIKHTDAEGRLGLADVLVEAENSLPGATAVSVATLTGHAVQVSAGVAMGLLHTTRENLQIAALREFNKVTVGKKKETVREVKLFPSHVDVNYYDSTVKSTSKAADLVNSARGKGSGSQEAYSFLRNFHSDLVHLDIAPMDELIGGDGDSSGEGLREIDFVVRNLKSR